MGVGGVGFAQQLIRYREKLPAGRTGADLFTEEQCLGCPNTVSFPPPPFSLSYSLSLVGVEVGWAEVEGGGGWGTTW